MKLVILGANGRTGRLVLRRALDEGAEVTAVVRSVAKWPRETDPRLSVVIGDPCDARFLRKVLHGQDAVISTLGGRSPTRKAASVYPDSAEAIAEAAWDAGVRKVAVTSTALLFPARGLADRILGLIAWPVVLAARKMERTLFSTGLDVVVARCGFLTDAETSVYRAKHDALPEKGRSVTRKALAHFLVDSVCRGWAGHDVVGVSGPISRRAAP
ncbi:NAD(P)-dependent oxidoreductase [Shimia aestuarii]|uniref:NAD(P)-dependent oxidoreductase n=1 Tax=Shimia aestuarii TaxID=254406 RepID=UPI001FB2BB0B|nr:NAD(P)-binding oxidoreductase [Shimia aestuarii]